MPSLSKIRASLSFHKSGRWCVFLILVCVASILAGIVGLTSGSIGILIAVIALGGICFLLIIQSIEIGFYFALTLGFLYAGVSRIFNNEYNLTTPLLLLIVLLFGIWILKGALKKDSFKVPWHPIILFDLVMSAYVALEVFNPVAASIPGWLSIFWQGIVYILFLFIALHLLSNIKKIRFFFRFIFGIIFVTALYGCIQQWLGFSSSDWRWLNTNPRIIGLFSLPGEGIRKFSFLTDPANYGTMMASGLVGMLVLMNGPFNKKKKILLGLMAVITFLGMSYSGTRTANVMIAAGVCVYILMTLYKKSTQIVAISFCIILGFLLYAPIHNNVTINRFRTAFVNPKYDPSFDVRLHNRRMMQPFMHQHPFGAGISTVGAAGQKYNPQLFLGNVPPDGAYFNIALEQGWIGLLLTFAFAICILYYCVHYFYQSRNEEIRIYYAAITAMLFSMYLGAYAQFTVTSIPQSLIYFSLLACIIKLHTFDAAPELSKLNS